MGAQRTFELLPAQGTNSVSLRQRARGQQTDIPDIGQLLIDSLLLEFTRSRISGISNELNQSTHIGIAATRAAEKACA